jgi:hypothetical protein
MENKWQAIWEKRKGGDILDLENLIALNGFDSGAGKIASTDWQEYAHRIVELLEIKDDDSVYEVGCGCGAFLYALKEHKKSKWAATITAESLLLLHLGCFPKVIFNAWKPPISTLKFDMTTLFPIAFFTTSISTTHAMLF